MREDGKDGRMSTGKAFQMWSPSPSARLIRGYKTSGACSLTGGKLILFRGIVFDRVLCAARYITLSYNDCLSDSTPTTSFAERKTESNKRGQHQLRIIQ